MPAREFGKHRQRTGRTFAVTLVLVVKFSGTLVTIGTGPGTLLLTFVVVMLRIRLHVTAGEVLENLKLLIMRYFERNPYT